MPAEVITDAFISVNGIDLSDQVKQVTINYSAEIKDDFGVMGDKSIRRGVGLKDWSMGIEFLQNFDAAKVDATIFPLVGAAEFPMKVRKSKTDAISATNPEFQGNGLIDGDYSILGASVGETSNTSITVVGADGVALIRDTTP